MRTPFVLNRRSFLVGASGLAVAIPFLPSLARAQTAPVQRYFFSWRIANGYFGQHWYPSDSVLASAQVVEPNVRELALSSITGPISPILDASFDAYRSQTLLLRHVDHLAYETGHAAVTGLTGFNTSTTASTWNDLNPGINEASLPPSIDQLIAAKLSGAVAKPPLNLSINYTGNGGWSCSYKKGSSGKFEQQPGLYPRTAFDLLFANLPGTDPVAARRLRLRTSAIDLVKSHFDAVRTNPKLSSEDKGALSRYVDELHQLGQRLNDASQGQCTPPGTPAALQPTEQSVDAMATAHVDIALAAMKCGLTKVVNFYLDPDVVMPGIGGRGHHSLSHDNTPADLQGLLTCHQWSFRHLKRLLAGLAGAIDPSNGQSYLHNSLVFVNNEIGNQSGQSGTSGIDNNHLCIDGQYALFGSANGYLRTGYLVDYRTDFTRHRWSQYIGTAYNRLLVTNMLAMGLAPSDWEVNGQPGYGSLRGSIYDLTPPGKVVVGDLRSPLPRLKA